MKKLIEMITHNFGWKVVSLIAAVAMWFLIVNITNPTRDQMIPVLLRIEGLDALRENNIVLLNAEELESTYINLMLRGSYSSLEQAMQNRNDDTLYAFIDLSPIDISRSSEFLQKLPIRVKYGSSSPNYDILSSSPGEVDVVLDRYVTRTFPVIAEKIDDDMQGYISFEPVVTPENVVISGPESIVEMVAEVRAAIEVGAAKESFETVRRLEILDVDGRDISLRLEVSTNEVSIYVGVGTYTRIPITAPVITGEVANGYRVTSVTISPKEVEVEGPSADIKELDTIRLMPIDVSGMNRTRVETYDIRGYLEGTNLNVRDGSEGRVRVTITVEREITKEILVPVDQIEIRGMSEGESVLLPPGEVVRLEVQGIASEIVEFENSRLVSYIDVTGRAPGTYQLEVLLQVPDGIRQTGTEAVEVIVGDFMENEEPEIDETVLE